MNFCKWGIMVMILLLPPVSGRTGGVSFGLTEAIQNQSDELKMEKERRDYLLTKQKEQSEEDESDSVVFTEFTHLPFDAVNVGGITPIGTLMGTHTRSQPNTVRPFGVERHFIWHRTPGVAYNVYAPATTYIMSARKSEGIGDYGFNFKITDQVSFRIDHIHVLDASLEAAVTERVGGVWNESSPFLTVSPPLPVQAGDLLGQTGVKPTSANWDWFVGEGSAPNPGILFPDHYTTSMAQLYISAKSVYDYLSDDLKSQCEALYGYWSGSALLPGQTSSYLPVLGKCGYDQTGTLAGFWFYDTSDDPAWGPKAAGFVPYFLDNNKWKVKLAVPELDLYGIWEVSVSDTGNTDRLPPLVTSASPIVYYVLNDPNAQEKGLLMVQIQSDGTLFMEAHLNSFDPSAYPAFSINRLVLQR